MSQNVESVVTDRFEHLLCERSFDDVSISEFISAAGTSAGAFYTRFKDKEALLEALHIRYQSMVRQASAERLAPKYWEGASLEEIIRGVVHSTLMLYRKRRGYFRAVVLREYARPTTTGGRSPGSKSMPPARLGALMESRCDEIDHPNPRLAGAMGFLLVLGALREKVLFADDIAQSVRISDRRLEDELVKAFLAYIGAKHHSVGSVGKAGSRRRRRRS